MFISSILFSDACPMPTATAFSIISEYNSSLFFSDNFLESLIYKISTSSGRITAAAYTGPAKGPLPTSSIPQRRPNCLFSFSNFLISLSLASSFSLESMRFFAVSISLRTPALSSLSYVAIKLLSASTVTDSFRTLLMSLRDCITLLPRFYQRGISCKQPFQGTYPC